MIILRVIARVSGNRYRSLHQGMNIIPVAALPAPVHESSLLQINHEIAYLRRHIFCWTILLGQRSSRRENLNFAEHAPMTGLMDTPPLVSLTDLSSGTIHPKALGCHQAVSTVIAEGRTKLKNTCLVFADES